MQHLLANPWALSLLAALPVLTLLAALGRRLRRRRQARLGNPLALAALVEGSRGWPALRALVLMLAMAVWIVGIAGPQWGLDPDATASSGRDLVVLIDVSRSMLADDVIPNRLEGARESLYQLANAVQRRGGHRLGLVAVAAQAQVLCPLTQDFDHFREKVADLDVDELAGALGPHSGAKSGTRLGVGLQAAVAALDERYRQGQTVLMISDGDDPAGDEEWNTGIAAARAAGVVVHTVGIGDPIRDSLLPVRFADQPVTSRLHESPLQGIAASTRGEYVASRTSPPQLDEFFRDRIEPGPTRDVADDPVPVYQQRYAGFLAAALGLLTLGLLMVPLRLTPLARRRWWWPFTALLLVSAAPALEPFDAVREGNEAFERGDYEAAVRFYDQAEPTITDPGLVAYNRATALFHLAEQVDEGQRLAWYRAAEFHYRSCSSDDDPARRARALYGLGTCQLRLSQGTERRALAAAIENFGRCLDTVTDAGLAADARHNRELAKLLWLKASAAANSSNPNSEKPNDRPETSAEKPPERVGSNDTRPTYGKIHPERIPPENGSQAKPIQTDQAPPPGGADLRPLPDTAEPVPLTSEEAARHLRQAAERVWQERRDYLRRPVPPRANVKDW